MLQAGRRQLPRLVALERLCLAFSSQPDKALAAEVVRLPGALPLLVKLPERQWGARVSISEAAIPSTAGERPDRVAVVRDAFAPHDKATRSLAASVQPLGNGAGLAVAADIAEPHNRLLVDEYHRSPDGSYSLQHAGLDLLRTLRKEGVRVSYVPDLAAAAELRNNGARSAAAAGPRQSTNHVLMVAPTAFGFNAQAAQDNSFMHAAPGTGADSPAERGVTAAVLREFAGLHHELTEVAGVRVDLFEHAAEHGTPDAVFPNNWFSTHPAGEAGPGGVQEPTLVLYPMKCPNRQMERRPEIQAVLRGKGYSRVLDLSAAEREGRFFEGTGALVLDRINGIAYVALSERADEGLAREWAQHMGYRELVAFRSFDIRGKPVYHTNVMMAIGTGVAVVCADSVTDQKERQHLLAKLGQHHEVVQISREQMDALCGNVIELQDGRGLPVLALSSRAFRAFQPEQRAALRRHLAALHHAPIDTLEHIGGGGVRCAIGEVF